jgi:hypothetical protein
MSVPDPRSRALFRRPTSEIAKTDSRRPALEFPIRELQIFDNGFCNDLAFQLVQMSQSAPRFEREREPQIVRESFVIGGERHRRIGAESRNRVQPLGIGCQG